MSKTKRSVMLSSVVAGLMLLPALGAAQDKAQGGEAQPEGKAAQAPLAGAKLVIADAGSKQVHRCSPKTEVEISGTDNEVALSGECKSVSVTGSANRVLVEATGTLSVMGSENEVVWKRGLGGKPPKVTQAGSDNKVSQAH